MGALRAVRLVLAVLGVAVVLAGAATWPRLSAAHDDSSRPAPEAPSHREHDQQVAPLVDRPARYDEDLRKRFVADYRSAETSRKRDVFKRYLPTLGADGILDVLESANRFCHNEGHDLGREIFASLRDIGPAVQVCGNRCTSACLHGVLSEAFIGAGDHRAGDHVTLADLKRTLTTICGHKAVVDAYEPGNCAHGLGHGLLILSRYDLRDALGLCAAFDHKPLEHYCASGVFMEYEAERHTRDPATRSLHYPCDTYTQFPAACYRYRTWHLLKSHNWALVPVVDECLRLTPAARLGCFYGLGNAHRQQLASQPEKLSAICGHGDADAQAMCVNGAIETLSDYRPEAALAACRALTGERSEVCRNAVRSKRYGLGKPFHLYYPE